MSTSKQCGSDQTIPRCDMNDVNSRHWAIARLIVMTFITVASDVCVDDDEERDVWCIW